MEGIKHQVGFPSTREELQYLIGPATNHQPLLRKDLIPLFSLAVVNRLELREQLPGNAYTHKTA